MDASIQNKELFGKILRSAIGVISRRTSDAYANVIIRNAIRTLSNKYVFLNYVKILGVSPREVFDIVEINDEINSVDVKEIGKASKEFIQLIIKVMGKNAGYYFIREIKEDLPYDYENTIKKLGLDLDFLQLEFITDIKQNPKYKVPNSEAVKHIFTVLFEILDSDFGRDFAFKNLHDTVLRLTTGHDSFRYVKINDTRSIQNIDIVTVTNEIDSLDSSDVGSAIQKAIQEINNSLDGKGGFNFVEKLKNKINPDYSLKLREMGVDLSVIKLRQELLVKQVIRVLVEILSESSTPSYAVMLLNSTLKNYEVKFDFFKNIKIDGIKFSQGVDGIDISSDIDSVRPSELGRSLQRVIEQISVALGDEAGRYFVDKFKRKIGQAYLLRMEEIGVNLHMIELRRNLAF
jgi:hypothetical protein